MREKNCIFEKRVRGRRGHGCGFCPKVEEMMLAGDMYETCTGNKERVACCKVSE